jgi:hypothetical protein
MRAWLDGHGAGRPIDLVLDGTALAEDPAATDDRIGALADAGADWWIEANWMAMGDVGAMRARVDAGPPVSGAAG